MNSSTSSSRRWLQIFFAILVPVFVTLAAASEWMVRTYVVPHDNFEWISGRLRDSTQPNAAFGDSHVAAVPDFNKDDFVNLGVGATTIRRLNDRVRFYFSQRTPGEVIIQADPHLFAEYRLEAQGSYVPESYSNMRLRVFDPRHRGFMAQYWLKLLTRGQLKDTPVTSYDRLWETVTTVLKGTETPAPDSSKTAASGSSTPAAGSPDGTGSASAPAASAVAAEATASKEAPQKTDEATMAKFNAFMDYEVTTHTPAPNFQQRDEARIYRDLIKFLVSRGAKVCLMNYPVDKYYRERADRIPAFAETRKFYKEVAAENHIPYVSFWDRFDDQSMYQNTDHVNEKGSPILAREARQACFGKPVS